MVTEIREDLLTAAQVAEWAAFCEADEDYSYACQSYSEMAAEAYGSFYANCSDPSLTVGMAAREVGLRKPVAPTEPSFKPAWDGAPFPFKDTTRFELGGAAYEPF